MDSNQQPTPSSTTSSTEPPQKILCTKCHSFYGTALTNSMCSKCFRESGGVLPTQTPPKADAAEAAIATKEEQKLPEPPARPI
jgi:A20-like zinc finger